MQTLERYWFYIFIVFLLFYFASLKTDETSKVAFRLLTYIAINTCHAFIKCCHYDYLQGDYNHICCIQGDGLEGTPSSHD